MANIARILATMRRPRLLIRAARFGLDEYNRERDLKRIMRSTSTPSQTRAVTGLIAEEAHLEEARQTGGATYSVSRHVEVLIALMAEARLSPKSAS